LQLYHTVGLLRIKHEHESNLGFKITDQNELLQIAAIQLAIAVSDGWLTCISMGLCRVHGNLQKCIPGDADVVSRSTLLNWRMNVPDPPCGMMEFLTRKGDAIESVATGRLCFLHKHNMGCGMALMAWIQSACKGGRYRISIVISQMTQCEWRGSLCRAASERNENTSRNYRRQEA